MWSGGGTIGAKRRPRPGGATPFGQDRSASGTGNEYKFTGKEWDEESGLYYFWHRYYDPEIGRFINKDLIGFLGGINLYEYVGSNPINWIDPWGLKTIKNGLIYGGLDFKI